MALFRLAYTRVWRRGGRVERACSNRCVALVKDPYHRLVALYRLLEAIYGLENNWYTVEAPGAALVDGEGVVLLCGLPCTLRAQMPSMTGYEDGENVDEVVLVLDAPEYPGVLRARCEPRGWTIVEPFEARLPPMVRVTFAVGDEPGVLDVEVPPWSVEDARRLLKAAVEYQATGKTSPGVECRCVDRICHEVECSCECEPAPTLDEGLEALRRAIEEYQKAREHEEYLRARLCPVYLEESG